MVNVRFVKAIHVDKMIKHVLQIFVIIIQLFSQLVFVKLVHYINIQKLINCVVLIFVLTNKS